MKRSLYAILLIALLASGCATTRSAPASNADASKEAHPADPFEPVNRVIFGVNEFLDTMFLKPAAKAYVAVTPDLVKVGVGNFFSNINDGYSLVNDLLQGKGQKAGDDFRRVFVNSTFGFGGIFDLATPLGYEKGEEDFGQTLGHYGFRSGPYLMLPLLGPSSVRDTIGLLPTFVLDPILQAVSSVPANNTLKGLRVLDTRAGLLPSEKLLQSAALDKYTFLRSAYLQRRQSLVYDGKPPLDD